MEVSNVGPTSGCQAVASVSLEPRADRQRVAAGKAVGGRRERLAQEMPDWTFTIGDLTPG